MLRKADIVTISGFVVLGAVVWLTCMALNGCQSQEAKFAEGIGQCELKATCAEYVACRRDLAAEFKRPFSGYCVAKDGGAE